MDSALLSSRDGYPLEPKRGLNGVKPPVEFGERTRDCSLCHAGKEGPHLAMTGASRGFSRAAVPVWGFHEVGRGAQGASRVAPGKLGFNGHVEGNASLLSSHGRVSGLKMR